VNTNLVAAGVQVCKMKAAAMNYESMVGFLSSCGADVGNVGHGTVINYAYNTLVLLLYEWHWQGSFITYHF
jgi:hypothetical protein